MSHMLATFMIAASLITTPIKTEFDVPEGNTSPKTYMSYKAITDKNSHQHQLQLLCLTSSEGLRVYYDDDTFYYVVAMGTYYADNVGDKFQITLDTGEKLNVIVGDIKSPSDTIDNMYHIYGNNHKNVIEFLVDTEKLPNMAKIMGDISYISSYFEGNITEISLIERASR